MRGKVIVHFSFNLISHKTKQQNSNQLWFSTLFFTHQLTLESTKFDRIFCWNVFCCHFFWDFFDCTRCDPFAVHFHMFGSSCNFMKAFVIQCKMLDIFMTNKFKKIYYANWFDFIFPLKSKIQAELLLNNNWMVILKVVYQLFVWFFSSFFLDSSYVYSPFILIELVCNILGLVCGIFHLDLVWKFCFIPRYYRMIRKKLEGTR